MSEVSVNTQRVYGISNSYIDSYVSRDAVDDSFLDGLKSDKHIIIYGSSKQGKTSLIREHILDNEKIVIECGLKTQVLDIYKSILRQLNVDIIENITINKGSEAGGTLGVKAKLKIPFMVDVETGASPSYTKKTNQTINYKTIEYDLSLAQDISEIIKSCTYNGRIVLENFHYLDEKVQKELSYDLRTFQDNNILFIILGIWRERNRLTQYNGDLTDRLIEVPVEPWHESDLIRVIKEGEPYLNVCFDNISRLIIEKSNGSVGILQELCKYCCLKAGVKETCSGDKIFLNENHLEEAAFVKRGDYSSRHMRCIEDFISDDDTKLNLSYYFIIAILNMKMDLLVHGIPKLEVEKMINEIKSDKHDIRQTDFKRFFNHIIELQLKKNISPPIFDFDKGTQNIKIIDSTFIFFIDNINKKNFIKMLANPE